MKETKPSLKNMENANESLNSLKEEKTTLEEELKTLDSEADVDRVNEINERLTPLKDEILEASEEVNKQLFSRAKKAEGFILEDGKWVKKPQPAAIIKPKEEPAKEASISIIDIKALQDVHEDDIEEVQEYAKFKGFSIKEILKTDVIKTLLAEKEEQRKVANATNTGTSRKSTSKASDEAILSEAQKGNLPTDDEGIARLARLSIHTKE